MTFLWLPRQSKYEEKKEVENVQIPCALRFN